MILSRLSQVKALLEVSLLTLIYIALVYWPLEALIKGSWPWPWYGWFSKAGLMFITLCAILLPKRKLEAYGFSTRVAHFSLKWGLKFMIAFILPSLIVLVVLLVMGQARLRPLTLTDVVLSLVWYMVFVGFAEEAYFRGYVQSRLNEAFGKPYRRLLFNSWRVNYGLGLPITAIFIFGLPHLANWVNPFTSECTLGLGTSLLVALVCFAGLVLGAIREATGDIWASTLFHGGVVIAYWISSLSDKGLAMVSLGIGWGIFFTKLFDTFLREAEHLNARLTYTDSHRSGKGT